MKAPLTPLLSAIAAISSLPARGAAETYASDLALLRRHFPIIELRDGAARVAIAPSLQGRVMTSSAAGDEGHGHGWLNDGLIAQGVLTPEQARGRLEEHIHVFGGEERFWLGPEGGQFGIFFGPGAPFDFDSWKTPPALDTEPFDVVESGAQQAVFQKRFGVTNHSGTRFDLEVGRTIRLLPADEIRKLLGIDADQEVKAVAYETINRLRNRGTRAWTRESGLLSIWLLGMFKPSPGTVMAIPVDAQAPAEAGPLVNDDYFGKVPPDRLKVRDGVVYFKGDGGQRGKIGVPPGRSLGVAGSFSPEHRTLTLVISPPVKGAVDYVNSAWEIQSQPYRGDVINAYNDGSPEPGKPPLGPFYELETSSPAAALEPGGEIIHRQTTIHLVGDAAQLDPVALRHLRTSTGAMHSAFDAR